MKLLREARDVADPDGDDTAGLEAFSEDFNRFDVALCDAGLEPFLAPVFAPVLADLLANAGSVFALRV